MNRSGERSCCVNEEGSSGHPHPGDAEEGGGKGEILLNFPVRTAGKKAEAWMALLKIALPELLPRGRGAGAVPASRMLVLTKTQISYRSFYKGYIRK